MSVENDKTDDEVPNGETHDDLRTALVEAYARLEYVDDATDDVDASNAKDEVLEVERELLDRDLSDARQNYEEDADR